MAHDELGQDEVGTETPEKKEGEKRLHRLNRETVRNLTVKTGIKTGTTWPGTKPSA